MYKIENCEHTLMKALTPRKTVALLEAKREVLELQYAALHLRQLFVAHDGEHYPFGLHVRPETSRYLNARVLKPRTLDGEYKLHRRTFFGSSQMQ